MAENTSIEWCDHTFNPWVGCTKVGPGCDHCYAERRMDTRLHRVQWGAGQQRQRTKTWGDPVKWNSRHQAFHAEHGRRQRVFCASLADVFDNEVDPSWRAGLFALIAQTPNLDWLLLTKRIGNVAKMIEQPGMQKCGLPPNVWLGATVVNQEEADRDIPKLLAVPARVRFLSIEPMLGPISFEGLWASKRINDATNALEVIDWVICGGESGPGARPMHADWARQLRDECEAFGTPFMFKQWGEWAPDWEGAETCQACGRTKFDAINSHGECGHCGIDAWMPADKPLDTLRRVGKKAAGRLLDGVTHDGFPT